MAALAVALAGCVATKPVANPLPLAGSGTPPPDGLDYMQAVQCGGLLWSLQAVEYRVLDQPLISMTGLYREWAELRASEAGHDPALALRDMAAIREDIIASTGGFSPALKAAAIREAYPEFAACRARARAADFDVIVIGG